MTAPQRAGLMQHEEVDTPRITLDDFASAVREHKLQRECRDGEGERLDERPVALASGWRWRGTAIVRS